MLTRLEAHALPCVVCAFLFLTCTANISNWQPFLSLHTKVNLLGTAFPVAKDRKKAISQALAMRVGFLQSPHSESKTNQTSGSPLQCGDWNWDKLISIRWWSVSCLIIFVNYPENYNKPYRQDKALTCIRTSNEAMCLLRNTMIKSRFVSWWFRVKSSTQNQTKLIHCPTHIHSHI